MQPTQACLEVLEFGVVNIVRMPFSACLRWPVRRRLRLKGGGLRGIEKLLARDAVDHRWRSLASAMPRRGWIHSGMWATRQLVDAERGFIDGVPRGFNCLLHRSEDVLLPSLDVLSLCGDCIFRRCLLRSLPVENHLKRRRRIGALTRSFWRIG